MFNSKNLSLALAFPLLLIGCGNEDASSPVVAESAPVVDKTKELVDFSVDLKEDPIEQIDTINDSIELLEVETPPVAEAVLTGTFIYDVDYKTPKGVAPLEVSFVVSDNVITEVSLNGEHSQQTSNQYQKLVESELGELIIGKNYMEVSALPSKVAGSSLTPTAFNQALAQLQAEA